MTESRCIVVDAHPLMRAGVAAALSGTHEVESAKDFEDAISLAVATGPANVAVIACRYIGSPDDRVHSRRVDRFLKASPGAVILAYGQRPESDIAAEALQAGASGYVWKSSGPERLREGVAAIERGETYIDPAVSAAGPGPISALTPRQRQVLQLFANGLGTEGAAAELGVSTETVRTHSKQMLRRLGAVDRSHAVAIALRSATID